MASEASEQGGDQDEISRYYSEVNTEWRNIQQNAYTRWANERLKASKLEITDLETDFSDGIRLIRLAESLSGVKMKRHNAKPKTRTQKLENVTMCLQFLEQEQKVRLVNIGKNAWLDLAVLIMSLSRNSTSREGVYVEMGWT